MPRFLIDVNLPCRFSLWSGPEFVHVREINDEWADRQVWGHALKHELIIVTKDVDFSDRVMLHKAPPKVIHICVGNLRMRELHLLLTRVWPEAVRLVLKHKLVRVFLDRLECVG